MIARHLTFLLLALAFLMMPHRAMAQSMLGSEEVDVDILRPMIGIEFGGQPESDLGDGSGTYRMITRSVYAAIPVYESLTPENPDRTYTGILLRGSVAAISPQMSFLGEQHLLYSSMFGATAGIVTAKGNFYSFSLNGGFAEDRKTLTDLRLRATGTGVGTYKTGSGTTFLFGFAYSYNFDRGLWVPILGFRSRGEGRWSYSFIFPFVVRAGYRYDTKWSFGATIRPNGNRFRFSNEGTFGNAPATVNLRIFQMQAGVEARWMLDPSVRLTGEVGVLGARRILWSTDSDDLRSTTVAGSGYAMIGLRFSFDASVFEEVF